MPARTPVRPPTREDLPAPGPYAHPAAIRKDFSERLSRAMMKRGWSQSDLARAAAKHSHNKKFGRDLVSGYVRGKFLPHPLHLDALAKTFGVPAEELMPSGNLPRRGDVTPPQDLRSLGDGRASLRINQIVPMDVALKILQVLNTGK